jgi:DNA adenine methylase
MLSNSAAPFILSLYDLPEFYQHRVLASRSINSVGEGRGKIEELVVTSYPTTPSPSVKELELFPAQRTG